MTLPIACLSLAYRLPIACLLLVQAQAALNCVKCTMSLETWVM